MLAISRELDNSLVINCRRIIAKCETFVQPVQWNKVHPVRIQAYCAL